MKIKMKNCKRRVVDATERDRARQKGRAGRNEAAVVRGVAKPSKAAARRVEEGRGNTHTARHTHTLDNAFVCAYLPPSPPPSLLTHVAAPH